MTILDQLIADRAALYAEIDELNVKINAAYRRKLLTCKHCSKRSKIGNLVYIQTHWYKDEPYSERWEEGEGNFECPKCGKRNRSYHIPEMVMLKRFFKTVKDEYDERW